MVATIFEDVGVARTVDDLRHFNPGTTVRISDGRNTELALVRKAEKGQIVLTQPLGARFDRYRTVVEPQSGSEESSTSMSMSM